MYVWKSECSLAYKTYSKERRSFLQKQTKKTLFRQKINQTILRSFRIAPKYKFGYRIPQSYEEAIYPDTVINGNSLWKTTMDSKMVDMRAFNVDIDKGLFTEVGIPAGYKRIGTHFAYDVKADGRHKARIVADGSVTDVPID